MSHYPNEYPDPEDWDDPDAPDDDQVVCPNCGRWIYDDTEKCPHCGNWVVKSQALRGSRGWVVPAVTVVMVLLMLAFMLRGC
jgi:hypothetical protein